MYAPCTSDFYEGDLVAEQKPTPAHFERKVIMDTLALFDLLSRELKILCMLPRRLTTNTVGRVPTKELGR